MNIMAVMLQLAMNVDLFAARPTGPMIHCTARLGVECARPKGWRPWVPKYTDLISDDWTLVSKEQLGEMVKADKRRAA